MIPNYLEDKGKCEDIKFLFQTASMNQEDILLDNISLKKLIKMYIALEIVIKLKNACMHYLEVRK